MTPCISISLSLFFTSFQLPELNPCHLQISWRNCLQSVWYWDNILSVVSTSTKLTVFIGFSTGNQSFSINFTVHFQTYETFISRPMSVLAFAVISATISTNKQTPQITSSLTLRLWQSVRWNWIFDSRNCLELFPLKLTVSNLLATENFSERQTDRQAPPVVRISVSELCGCLEI